MEMQQCLPGEAKWIHGALPPKRTHPGIDTGETMQKILPGSFLLLCLFLPGSKDLPRLLPLCLPVAIAQDAIVPDFDEPLRQNVQQKPADELKRRKGHPFGPVSIGGVPVTKRDLIAFQPFDPLIADGHPMRIPSQIRQDVLRTAKRRLVIGDPFFLTQIGDERAEPGGGFPRRDLSCADGSCPTTA